MLKTAPWLAAVGSLGSQHGEQPLDVFVRHERNADAGCSPPINAEG